MTCGNQVADVAERATSEDRLVLDAQVRVVFGLEAQGHIPTIEAALEEGADWEEIGRRILWDSETARVYYERYLARMKERAAAPESRSAMVQFAD